MGPAWRTVWAFRNEMVIFLVPLLLLPLPLVIPTKEAGCGFTILVMAAYWCTEALPLAVTALIPVIFFPMFGIMESSEVCMQYLKDTNMLLVGGLIVAIAVEHWNLHKRIALRVLLIVGVRPALLMMGFMGVTAFLSMWISNTATTAMMVPIAQAVLDQLNMAEAQNMELDLIYENQIVVLEDKGLAKTGDSVTADPENPKPANVPEDSKTTNEISNGHLQLSEGTTDAEEEMKLRSQKHLELSKGMSLSVCYAASIGGTATLTGTTPNLIMKGQLDDLFPNNGDIINFATWFGFSFPCMFIMLVITWIWLQILFLGINFKQNFGCMVAKSQKDIAAYQVVKNEMNKLGRMTFAEIEVLVLFILLVLLWFTRAPGFIDGWATVLFNKGNKDYVTDATVVIFISIIMFVLPSDKPRLPCWNGGGPAPEQPEADRRPRYGPAPPLLTWKVVQQKMAWNVVILLGGGFALAKGSERSGLSNWLGAQLTPLEAIPPWAIIILLCLLIATFTECASNVATTSLFLPILAAMAVRINLNPLYVMLPCTLCASFAFMLPVATPPNSIVFSYGYLKVSDMVKAGFMVNLIGVLVISLAINTWGMVMFDLNTIPAWANSTANP
ncbi:solute carrier family 13 member 2 [Amblyraja radiata]|uniref:solute carrier family 13 member 2 n=1 Tax=Amblyraja radiata TaxID=386614 RepID=UPI00140292AD|nr:solute carrier family 13 member 2 [Amblyraja radiata]